MSFFVFFVYLEQELQFDTFILYILLLEPNVHCGGDDYVTI